MELASAIAILILLAALSVTGFVALFCQGRPLYLIGSLLAAGVLAWQAASSFKGALYCEFLKSSRRVLEFDLDGDGVKTMRVDRLPDVDGLQACLISRKGGSIKQADLAACRWRARDSAGPIAIDVDSRSARLFDLDWNESFGQGDRTWVELTYLVDNSNRPVLSDLQLLVLPCRSALMSSDFALLQFRIMAGFFSLSALSAAAGVVAQIIRRARKSPIPNLKSPGVRA